MTVKNITVLGSGVMGHGIAQVSATAGYNVVLRDIKQEFLDKAMEKIKWSLDKLVSKEKISKEEGDSIFSRITPIVDLNEAVKNAELVIEVVPEIMDLKKSVYAELDKAASPEVVFASNTSTLPITEILGQNGIVCPVKSTSSTIPRAISETPTSANALAHDFILSIASI